MIVAFAHLTEQDSTMESNASGTIAFSRQLLFAVFPTHPPCNPGGNGSLQLAGTLAAIAWLCLCCRHLQKCNILGVKKIICSCPKSFEFQWHYWKEQHPLFSTWERWKQHLFMSWTPADFIICRCWTSPTPKPSEPCLEGGEGQGFCLIYRGSRKGTLRNASSLSFSAHHRWFSKWATSTTFSSIQEHEMDCCTLFVHLVPALPPF